MYVCFRVKELGCEYTVFYVVVCGIVGGLMVDTLFWLQFFANEQTQRRALSCLHNLCIKTKVV